MLRLALPLATSLLFATSAAAVVGVSTPGDKTLASHVVAITGANGSVCTGTVIAADLVLTAGHCVQPGVKYQVIELGDGRPHATDVAAFEQHPQYNFDAANSTRPTADVALLKLAKPMSAKVVPVVLGERDFFPAGDRFTVAGYGSVFDSNDGTFGRLLAARLSTVRRQPEMQIRLIDPVTRGERSGRSACSGDSGGPVFEDTSRGRVIVGVISWAATASGTPGCGGLTGATPIAQVRPWIEEAAKSLGGKLATSAPSPADGGRVANRN